MSLEESIERIAEGLFAIAEALTPPRKRLSRPINAGTSTQIRERKENEMFVVDYSENFEPLPPAVGNDADIAKGIWSVSVDDTVVASADIEYDLDTRQPITRDVPWSGEKGKDAVKRLYYVDDEDPPNVSSTATETLAIRDTIGPNQPTAAGASTQLGERFVPDA